MISFLGVSPLFERAKHSVLCENSEHFLFSHQKIDGGRFCQYFSERFIKNMFHSENENFEILLDSLLVLDRDFLLDDTLEQFLSCFASVLARNPPVLLGRIEDELKELAEREEGSEEKKSGEEEGGVARERVKKVLKRLEELKCRGEIRCVQTLGRVPAKAAILEYVLEEHLRQDVCVLTNSRELAADIHSLSRLKSIGERACLRVAGFQGRKFGFREEKGFGRRNRFSDEPTFVEFLAGKVERKIRQKVFSEPKYGRGTKYWRWWGLFSTFLLLSGPVLLVDWLGLDSWQGTAFAFSVILTLFFLHYATFLMLVLGPLILAWLIRFFPGFPICWTLPTLMLFGCWICFRYSGKHAELLRPGGKKCVLRIVYRVFFQ